MSDEEGGWMNDDAEENEEEERTTKAETKPKIARKLEEPVVEKTEVQQILEAKMKKQEEDDTDRIKEIEEARRLEREKEDEELRKLKEKQAQRKKERELEDQKMEEQRRQLEEKRRQEDEQRKQRMEDEKRKKQELQEMKKAAAQAAMVGGRNFVIEKDKEGGNSTIDKFMNISKAKTEMSLNTGELQALKMRTINERVKPLALSELDNVALKAKAEELWKTIVVLETSKYDLAERSTRQEYDLKELNERQRQMNVKKHVAQGLDAGAANSPYPPKVQLISKYERRTDRRTFQERKAIFEVETKRLEDLAAELQKPAAKTREAWVKPKKSAGDEDGEEDNEENGEANEEGGGAEPAEEEEESSAPFWIAIQIQSNGLKMVITKDTYLPSYSELETEEIKLSSPALKAGATHFGLYCDNICKEFMLCRAEEGDPRRCLQEGKEVTACGLDFFRKVKKFCYEPFEKHWRCLEDRSQDMEFRWCRKSQYAFDSCVKEHIGQDRPYAGYFAQVRVHDSTRRPKPLKAPIREYEPIPRLPKDYPRPEAAYGSRSPISP
ncbi:putative NADH dehydrogenase [ubiquinone] 1 alpha subcomplex subunit 8 [Hypsibius exemplaris]|uniref:NADH dehydrogenase [ubiquinone] 1 alpha subcomplex subunit 8 n=1 Tax=Hypsibius exemplaris TaxID=2072580 RepID=A0A1W0X8Y2_HYPEX|nr:putative NADH dehydrogenase [ubiquinone] 1 alpha subcomplex subunit 8 [Hypsibius exemplaris]